MTATAHQTHPESFMATARRGPRDHPRGFLALAALVWALGYRALARASEVHAGGVPSRQKVEGWLTANPA